MAWAIGAARTHGVAVHGLRNAHHIGRVGTYGEMVAEAGLVSVHFVNGAAPDGNIVAPFGGREGRFLTNPVCIAVPGTAATPPVILDFATSQVAMGKVRVANNKKVQMEAGLLIDAEGRPTADPGVMYNSPFGAILPFGLHKGGGLSRPALTQPRAETPTHFISMGINVDLDQAMKQALREMIAFICTRSNLSREQAHAFCSLAVDFHVTQTVNGEKGVHGMLKKGLLF